MIFLKNDYSLGAHEVILNALIETNMVLADGYSEDDFCKRAEGLIKEIINEKNADVYFLPGGTQTNLTAISSALRPHHSVISADTGHICVHETGAIEATGHKINHVKTEDGKLRPKDIEEVMIAHEDEHYVKPRMIYISNSTETGLIYQKDELLALRKICDKYNLLLYLDGARLAMALSNEKNDVKIEDLPKIADLFYIGGTKCGALFGEALVIVNDSLKEDMRFLIKQRGGLIAKGRLLGVQFEALLKDNLYFKLGEHANNLAKILAEGIETKGYEFVIRPETNMLFPIFPKDLVNKLSKEVMFETWTYTTDTHKSIRLVTSWGTTKEEVDAFLKLI